VLVTSEQNLRDFCAAHGRPFEPPSAEELFAPEPKPAVEAAPAPAIAQERPAPAAPPRPAIPERQAVRLEPEPAPPVRRGANRAAITVGILAAVVLLLLFLFRGPSGDPGDPPQAEPPLADVQPPPVPGPPATTAPAAPPQEPAGQPAASAPEPQPPPAPEPAAPAPRTAPGSVTLAESQLCRTLSTSDWRCTPAADPAEPGQFFFYTRVRSPRATSVQHRWYHGGRLLRIVTLDVAANDGPGFRTYSRNTIVADRAGDWRIEVRDDNGAVIHDERFSVR
jgi:hypothetical protein